MIHNLAFLRTLEINLPLWREICCANGIMGAYTDFSWKEVSESTMTLGPHIRITCIKPKKWDFHPATVTPGSVQDYLTQSFSCWGRRYIPSVPGIDKFIEERERLFPGWGNGELVIIERDRPESRTEVGVVVFKNQLGTAEAVSRMIASPYEQLKVAV